MRKEYDDLCHWEMMIIAQATMTTATAAAGLNSTMHCNHEKFSQIFFSLFSFIAQIFSKPGKLSICCSAFRLRIPRHFTLFEIGPSNIKFNCMHIKFMDSLWMERASIDNYATLHWIKWMNLNWIQKWMYVGKRMIWPKSKWLKSIEMVKRVELSPSFWRRACTRWRTNNELRKQQIKWIVWIKLQIIRVELIFINSDEVNS